MIWHQMIYESDQDWDERKIRLSRKHRNFKFGKYNRGLNSEKIIEDFTRKTSSRILLGKHHRGLNSESIIEDWTRKISSRIELGKYHRGLNSERQASHKITKTSQLKIDFRSGKITPCSWDTHRIKKTIQYLNRWQEYYYRWVTFCLFVFLPFINIGVESVKRISCKYPVDTS